MFCMQNAVFRFVDAKKLEKAEAKIKQKQEKKASDNQAKSENITRFVKLY